MVEFEIEGVGKFSAKEELTILEELNIDNQIDQFLGGKLYELKDRAERLKGTQGELISDKLLVLDIIYRLNCVIVSKPNGFPPIGEITDVNKIIKIWNEYSKKKEIPIKE